MVWDNDRALRNLDSWLTNPPDDSDEDWDTYEKAHDTAENREVLASDLIDRLVASVYGAASDSTDAARFRERVTTIITKGLEHLDVCDIEPLYVGFSIAPDFDKFVYENRQDAPGFPDPNEDDDYAPLPDD